MMQSQKVKSRRCLKKLRKVLEKRRKKIAQWEGRRKSAVDNATDRVELLRVAAGMLTTRKPDISSRENEQKIGSEKKNEVNRPIEEKKNEKGESGHNGYNPLGSEVVGGGEDTIGGSQAKHYFDLSVKVDRVRDEEAGMEEKERDLEQTQIEGSEHEHEHENEYEDEDEQRHQQEHEHEEGQDERDEEHEYEERHQQGQEEEEEREVGERLRRVSEECQRDQKFLIKKVERTHFLHLSSPPFTLCWNQKAASTSLGQVFAVLSNNTFVMENGLFYRLPEVLSPRMSWELKSALSPPTFVLTVVRHPFARLVSAFRDKVSNVSSFASKTVREALNLTEEEEAPSWTQFVRYLLSTPPEQYDSHWFPQYLQCQPCHVKYSYIAKVETLAEDWKKIRTKVPSLPDLHQLNEGASRNPKLGEEPEPGPWHHLLAQLPESQLAALAAKFEMDFRLFGYRHLLREE